MGSLIRRALSPRGTRSNSTSRDSGRESLSLLSTTDQEKKSNKTTPARKPSRGRSSGKQSSSDNGRQHSISKQKRNKTQQQEPKAQHNVITNPCILDYDTQHMDAVIAQALAGCQKKPSLKKRLAKRMSLSSRSHSSGVVSSCGSTSQLTTLRETLE